MDYLWTPWRYAYITGEKEVRALNAADVETLSQQWDSVLDDYVNNYNDLRRRQKALTKTLANTRRRTAFIDGWG